jgi:hypothetical protein
MFHDIIQVKWFVFLIWGKLQIYRKETNLQNEFLLELFVMGLMDS